MKFRIRLKKTLGKKFLSMYVYDEKYIKSKVKEFNGVIKTNFWSNEILNYGVYHFCIACITTDYVIRMEKKNYPLVYLQEYKCKIKEPKMSEFIDDELKWN